MIETILFLMINGKYQEVLLVYSGQLYPGTVRRESELEFLNPNGRTGLLRLEIRQFQDQKVIGWVV